MTTVGFKLIQSSTYPELERKMNEFSLGPLPHNQRIRQAQLIYDENSDMLVALVTCEIRDTRIPE